MPQQSAPAASLADQGIVCILRHMCTTALPRLLPQAAVTSPTSVNQATQKPFVLMHDSNFIISPEQLNNMSARGILSTGPRIGLWDLATTPAQDSFLAPSVIAYKDDLLRGFLERSGRGAPTAGSRNKHQLSSMPTLFAIMLDPFYKQLQRDGLFTTMCGNPIVARPGCMPVRRARRSTASACRVLCGLAV